MNCRIRNAALLLSTALALTSVPLAASFAQAGNVQTQSIRVHSFDLDLATGAGQAELQRRIHHAVEKVCGPTGGVAMDDIMSYASCSKTAQASAMTQYEAMVRAAHDGKVASAQNRDVIVR
jgi:UrcA family protein